jgi:flagellar hook-basal body complex protein FliE
MNPISSIRPPAVQSVNPARPQESAQPSGAAQGAVRQVGQTFENALQSLSDTQANSDQLIEKLAAGENVDLHQVMIAAEQTDVNFRIAMAIRDRLVEAYREVNRMAI